MFSHLCDTDFWNILLVLSIASGLDWYCTADSKLFCSFMFFSFLLLVTSTFMSPRSFRRFSFPLLAALTCPGFDQTCSTPASWGMVCPSSSFNTTGSTCCSALFVWLLSLSAFVMSPWPGGSFFSQSLNELVLRVLTPIPLKVLS